MKKLFALLLCVAMICCAAMAFAVEAAPGKEVTVTLSITANPDGAATLATIGFSYDSSVLEFVKASAAGGYMAPGGAAGAFTCNNLEGLPTGSIGTLTFRVKENTTAKSTVVRGVVKNAINNSYASVSGFAVSSATITITQPEHVHTWDDGKVTTEPTCTKDGVTTFTCSSCDETKTEPIKATGEHLFDDGKVTTPATCTKDGVLTRTCTYGCGETKTEVIKATEHKPGAPVTVPATCEQDGSVTISCTVCNEVVSKDPIKALGHAYGEFVVTTEATCCADGVKTATCANDATHTKTEKIPATGNHTWDEGAVTTKPECEKDGVKTFKCTTEGCTATKTEKVAKLGHKYEEGADYKAPTCTEAGYSNAKCSVCGKKQNGEKIPATGHDYVGAVTTAPTCEADGVETFTCKHDATHTYTKAIKKLGHTWDEGAVTTAPTCEVAGVKTFTCKNDATHTKTQSIKALGHDWDAGVVTTAPTCEEEGVKTFTCKNDAAHTKTQAVKALGHKWGKWVVTKEPTEEEDGEQERTCETCGKVEKKAVSSKTAYIMTTCSKGIRFRDLENAVTDYWYMFTPIDLSVDGEQTFELIAGNIHKIGTVTVVVKEGTVTVTYELVNKCDIEVFEEFMTILPSLEGITELDFEAMTNYAYGEAISIEEQLGGDTKVLLLTRNLVRYFDNIFGLEFFDYDGEEYLTYAEELKQLMD